MQSNSNIAYIAFIRLPEKFARPDRHLKTEDFIIKQKAMLQQQIPAIGQEQPEPGEEETARKIAALLETQMRRIYKGKKQLRQIHPKMNGCVKAEIIVEKNLPAALQKGLFSEERSYPAWIRFSNGNTRPLPDYKKDMRGVALKVMDVPGEKIALDGKPAVNQDFILMNIRSFAAKRVSDFYQVLQVLTRRPLEGPLLKKIFFLVKNVPIILNGAKAKIHCNHPFELSYYSTVPFLFGNDGPAVKYGLFPSAANDLGCGQNNRDPDFLRLRMQETLSKNEAIFDFCVQFQTDPHTMPVEDPTVEWTSPFQKVATVRVPRQVFDTPERNEFGENLSFNVWHSLPEHRPLGNFNRSRKRIYELMSAFRHEWNHLPVTEPTASPDFFNDTNLNQYAKQQSTGNTADVP